MINNERAKKEAAILRQLEFCKSCFITITNDIADGIKDQNEDRFDNWWVIKNHTVYAKDIMHLRRQLLKAQKMLERG